MAGFGGPKKKRRSRRKKQKRLFQRTITKTTEDRLPEILKLAGSARGQSIKLTNVPYAGDLSEKLLVHAQQLETIFKDLQMALDKKDEGLMETHLDALKTKEEFGQKIQARTSVDFVLGG